MQTIKKIFFIPVGLPGMGKSTLAKYIKLATDNNL
jgi:adenylate kinase family enzyme